VIGCEVVVKKALVEFGLTEAEAELLANNKYVGVTTRTPKIDRIRKYWDVRLIKCGDFVNSYFLA